MAEYWVKSTADAEAEGPLPAAEVKRRASTGEIERQALISTDQVTWHPAGRVKGLFPPPAATPAPPGQGEFGASSELPPSRSRRRIGLPPAYPGTSAANFGVQATPAGRVAPGPPPLHDASPQQQTAEWDHVADSVQVPPPMPAPNLTASPSPRPATRTLPGSPPSLGYATPGVTGRGMIRARRTIAFTTVAVILCVVGLAHAWATYRSFSSGRNNDLDMLVMAGGALAWLLLSIAALVLWAIWVAGVHKDMQLLTAARYSVSPAKAVGFLFIPIFDACWAIFMPAKLAGAVNVQLEAGGLPPISRGLVTTCQIVSVVAPLLGLYGLTPLMYVIAMRTIQGGMNRLAAAQYAT